MDLPTTEDPSIPEDDLEAFEQALEAADCGRLVEASQLLKQFPQLAGSIRSQTDLAYGVEVHGSHTKHAQQPRTYVLGALLGEGGFSRVFEVQGNSQVCVKVLFHVNDKPLEGRFRDEIEFLRSSHHERIIEFIDDGVFDETHPVFAGQLFLVMRRYPATLADVLAEKKLLTNQETLQIYLGVAEALEFLENNSQAKAHRDIKPGNIMMDKDQVFLGDFGLLKLREGPNRNAPPTEHNIFGTPAYMSPEQIESTASVNIQSDLFSLAICIYEAATGRNPFADETSAKTLLRVANAEVPAIRDQRKDIDPIINNACMRCLEKRPEKRFESAADLVQLLKRTCEPTTSL